MIPSDLSAAVREFPAGDIGRPVLLAFDFDGVIAPLVDVRDDARPLPGSMTTIRRLAAQPGVQVALVSGRALADLRSVSGTSPEDDLALVGSHGAERSLPQDTSPNEPMDQAAGELLDGVRAALDVIAERPGVEVEVKPTGAVLHTRLATADVGEQAVAAALAGPAGWPGVHVTMGKNVVELAVVEASKGVAVQQLRAGCAAQAVLYVGDDVTDESVFETLGPGDIGVKVGPEPSHAAYRIEGPTDVLELLQLLVAERSQR